MANRVPKVQTKQINWLTEVQRMEGKDWRRDVPVYLFSNGRKFTEPHDLDGRGAYE